MDQYSESTNIYKRYINENSSQNFKTLIQSENPNESYNKTKFISTYDEAFPKTKIKIKLKCFLSPWITKGLIKSSKRKQKLYEKYLKNKTYKNQTNYKISKNLLEMIKIRSKKLHYSNLILKYQNK